MQCIIFVGFSRMNVDVNECFILKHESAMVQVFSTVESARGYLEAEKTKGLIIPAKHYDNYIVIAKGYLKKKGNANANYAHLIVNQDKRKKVNPNHLF